MGFFSQYTKEGHGITKEQANAPAFIQFFRILSTRFWSLIILDILYLIFCIPIVTIGPATAAMVKILRNWSRREHAFLWADFWETFKLNFKQGFIVGIINLVVWALLIYDLWFFWANGAPMIYVILIIISAVVWLFMNYYLFTMLVTFKLTLPQLYKNAFIFAWVGIIRNIGITVIIAAISWLFIIFRSNPLIMWIIFPCCFIGLVWYVIVFITYPLIKRTMIDGFDPKTGKRIEQQTDDK